MVFTPCEDNPKLEIACLIRSEPIRITFPGSLLLGLPLTSIECNSTLMVKQWLIVVLGNPFFDIFVATLFYLD